ncbi:MAG: hypothetical protein HZA24_02085 [Nitrospirae bacterium]|nr:hypothetical protein [Nitrospirota bacterium]
MAGARHTPFPLSAATGKSLFEQEVEKAHPWPFSTRGWNSAVFRLFRIPGGCAREIRRHIPVPEGMPAAFFNGPPFTRRGAYQPWPASARA